MTNHNQLYYIAVPETIGQFMKIYFEERPSEVKEISPGPEYGVAYYTLRLRSGLWIPGKALVARDRVSTTINSTGLPRAQKQPSHSAFLHCVWVAAKKKSECPTIWIGNIHTP
eukprot:1510156-Pleurochrysis_carterae.AAC.1